MNFRVMNKEDIASCASLVYARFLAEREATKCLPMIDTEEAYYKAIESIVDHNLAYVAEEQGKILGFMGAYGPIDEFFGNSKGVFIPNHGHGSIDENREYIYQSLLTYSMGEWAKEGLLSYAMTFFNHDDELKELMFLNGFGGRCMDAMKAIDQMELSTNLEEGYSIKEVSYANVDQLLGFKNKLVDHIAKSPVFFPTKKFDVESFRDKSEKRQSVFFGLFYEEKAVGYVEFMEEGESKSSMHPSVINITGAYLMPEHRGNGRYTSLLNHGIKAMKEKGYTKCGVDFETLNTTAYRFWRKHFEIYTISVARRVDEHVLR